MTKILFYIDTLSAGGAEKVLCTLVNRMDQSRFDITVQTLYPVEHQSFLVPGIRYRTVYPKKSKLYDMIYRIEAELGLTYRLHMRDTYDMECAYLECGPTKVLASSTNKKAKKLAWVHCDFKVAFGKRFAEKTEKYYKQYDKVVCVSEQCKQSFDELFGPGYDSVVLHNVIDSDEILTKATMPLPQQLAHRKFTLCCVGRFSAPKNYPRLLNTCAALRDEGYDFDLWVVGDGELREQLQRIIEEKQLQDMVFLLGFQSNPYPIMKAADLLVCSSNYEGFSTVITEGVILGKPIVTTDCSGMREILGDSEYGAITENSDEAFYQGVKAMLDADSSERERFAALSAERGKYFSMAALVADTERFLLNTLDGE